MTEPAPRLGFLGARHPHVARYARYGDVLWRAQEMASVDRLRAAFLEQEGRVLGAYATDGRHLGWPDWQFDYRRDPHPLVAETIDFILQYHRLHDDGDPRRHWALDELRRFWVMPHPSLRSWSPAVLVHRDRSAVALVFMSDTSIGAAR